MTIFLSGDHVGWLSAYDMEPSAGTLGYRYAINDVQWDYDVYLAVADCSRIGDTGTMTYIETGRELSFQVFDCSGRMESMRTAVLF